MTRPVDIEEHVATALRAEAHGVEPDPASLAAIRTRARAVRRRRRAALVGAGVAAAVAVALAVPGLDRQDEVTTMTSPPTTAHDPDPDALPGGEPVDPADAALWPDPAGRLYADPVAAAQAFVEVVIGVNDPPLSDFRPGEPGAGEIDVERWAEDASRVERAGSTLQLRRLDGEHWFVVAAECEDVRIATPEPMAALSPHEAITGEARAFEGTVTVELRAREEGARLIASDVGIAGAAGVLEPYSLPLTFAAPDAQVGIVVVRDEPGIEMAVPSFAARPVRVADAPSPAPDGTAAPEAATSVPPA